MRFLQAGFTFRGPSLPQYLVALFHSLLCDCPGREWSGSHSHMGSGLRPVADHYPPRHFCSGAEGLDSGREGTTCLGHCSQSMSGGHLPALVQKVPWSLRSGQPGHVNSPEDNSEIKDTFPEPWHSRVNPQTCPARQAAKASTGPAHCPNSHAFLRHQSNLTSF